jgi:hypothetical protein
MGRRCERGLSRKYKTLNGEHLAVGARRGKAGWLWQRDQALLRLSVWSLFWGCDACLHQDSGALPQR